MNGTMSVQGQGTHICLLQNLFHGVQLADGGPSLPKGLYHLPVLGDVLLQLPACRILLRSSCNDVKSGQESHVTVDNAGVK